MLPCRAVHPDHPEVVCREILHHSTAEHQGYWTNGSWIPQNEIRWPVAEAKKRERPCQMCGAVDGHHARCGVVFDPYHAFRGGTDDPQADEASP